MTGWHARSAAIWRFLRRDAEQALETAGARRILNEDFFFSAPQLKRDPLGRTMRRPRPLFVVLWLVAMPAPALAQGSGDYARRAVAHLAERLAADSRLPDGLRHLTPSALVALPDSGYVRVLNDSEASDFFRILTASLHQLPDSLCGRFLQLGSGGPPNVETMLLFLDSATVDGWVAVLDRMVRASATSPTPGRASPEEVRAANVAVLNSLDADRRQRLAWIAQHPPPTTNDACWAIRVIMDGMAQLPVPQLGPVVRTNFASSRSAPPKR